jgi:molybdopterin/thiamine biosynthesis adenylyltransferase
MTLRSVLSEDDVPKAVTVRSPIRPWSYEEAFCRNRGLISETDQQLLRHSRIAIAGMGGVGGIHLITLARLGVGSFHIADPDTFDIPNFNRQYGATVHTLHANKAQVMAEQVQAINPEVRLKVFTEPITPANVGEFLKDTQLFIDGIDFFAMDTRRMVFREARARGIWGLTAGPIGFSTAWLVFSPTGMSFDDYFDLQNGMDELDQMIAFLVGLAPRATQRAYADVSKVDPQRRQGPSTGLACHLSSGVAAAEAIKILLGKGTIRPAPHYFQFDAYRHKLCRGRLWWGNRNPLQRLKRWLFRRYAEKLGWDQASSVTPSR